MKILNTIFYSNPTKRITRLFKLNLINEGESDMDNQKIIFALIGIFLLSPVASWAAPEVNIKTVAEKEIVETVNGKPVKKRVPADNADPGQNLIFTLNYENKGNEKAVNVKIDNPIPKGTAYVIGSGIGKNSKMLFSIDGGKTYKAPSLLKYTVTLNDGKKIEKQASPDQYTNVRWVINEIPPGKSGKVGFQVKVK